MFHGLVRLDLSFRLLHQAALWDNAELLEDLLNGDELECLNARDSWGRTALHAAATTENSQCLRILTQAGAGSTNPSTVVTFISTLVKWLHGE